MATAPYTLPTSSSTEHKQEAKSNDSVSVGPYQLHDLIERGKSGPLFRASHEKLRHTVALQVLQSPTTTDSTGKVWSVDQTTKFTKQIETASRVVHDNVIRPIHHGEQDDVRYVAMEYVDGVSLRTILDREIALDDQIACEITLQVATGLRHIHETGMVHGNIRPENVLLTKSGIIKISGLGISEFQTMSESENNDASYLAPEQMAGEQFDGRADIFALGCTLFELMSGKKAFDNDRRNTLPSLPQNLKHSVSPKLAATLAAMMAFDSTERLQSSNDVVHEMCSWANADRLPELVAWHMNAANAGLAPAATFYELERREKARANSPSPAKRSSREAAPANANRTMNGRKAKAHTAHQLTANDRTLYQKLVIPCLVFATLAVSACGIIVLNQAGAFSGHQPTEHAAGFRSTPIKALPSPTDHTLQIGQDSPRRDSYHAKLTESLTERFGLPPAEWVLSPDESTPINDAVHYGHMVAATAVGGMDFTRTVTMDVSERGGAPWDAGYFIPNIEGLEVGDRLLLVLWLRTKSADQDGKLRIFCEHEDTDVKDLYLTLEPNLQWQRYLIPFESKSNDPRRIGFHLAFSRQVIECGGLAFLNYRQTVPFAHLPHELNGEAEGSPGNR